MQPTSSGISRPMTSLTTSRETESRTSHFERRIPLVRISVTALPASSSFLNLIWPKAAYSGVGRIFTVTSVTTPSVPSDPMKRWVKSKPEELLGLTVPVFSTRPSANTTSRPRIQSLVPPYLTARSPLALVFTVPPMEARGALLGSGG